MEKGTTARIIAFGIIAMLVGGAFGYGLTYIFPTTGTVIQTKFSSFRTLAYINDGSTSPAQVADTQLSVQTSGASYLVIRFTTSYIIYLFTGHDGLTRFQVNLTMNGETVCLKYIECSSDGAVGASLESGGGLVLEYVTGPLLAGTYTFTNP